MPSTEHPFSRKMKYRVKKDYSELNHSFQRNEIVTFSTQAYDPHNGVTRYWFEKSSTGTSEVWHVWDSEPNRIQAWKDFFEELPQES